MLMIVMVVMVVMVVVADVNLEVTTGNTMGYVFR